MQSCVVRAHVIPKHPVKLGQGGNGFQVKGVEPGFLQGSEPVFDLGLGCAVPDPGVEQYSADGTADQRELFPA